MHLALTHVLISSPLFNHSAFDCWGFRVDQFAARYAPRFGVTAAQMAQYLWEPHYVRPSSGKIVKKAPKKVDNPEPLFVKLVLQPVWSMYEAMQSPNPEVDFVQIVKTLGLVIPEREMQMCISRDWRARVSAVFPRWLSISECLLQMTVNKLPSPVAAQAQRLPKIMSDCDRYLKQTHSRIKQLAISQMISQQQQQQQSQSGEKTMSITPSVTTTQPVHVEPTPEAIAAAEKTFASCLSQRESRVYALAKGVKSCDRHCKETLVYVVKVVDLHAMMPRQQSRDSSAARSQPRTEYQRGRFKAEGGALTSPPPVSTSTSTSTSSSAGSEQVARGVDGDNEGKREEEEEEEEEEVRTGPRFMAVARVFAGTLASSPTAGSAGAAAAPSSSSSSSSSQTPAGDGALSLTVTTSSSSSSSSDPASSSYSSEPVFTVYGPKYSTREASTHASQVATVPAAGIQVHVLRGNDSELIKEAPAGTVVGITGIDDVVFKFYSLASVPNFPVFRPLVFQSHPIFKVVVEPESAEHFRKFSKALALLDKIDPNVQVGLTEQGEHFIAASGELHIERCIRDLNDSLCVGVPIRVHPPSVSFRETIVEDDAVAQSGKSEKQSAAQSAAQSATAASAAATKKGTTIRMGTNNGCCQFRIRAVPLPKEGKLLGNIIVQYAFFNISEGL